MVKLEIQEGIATVTLNAPEKYNALSPEMIDELTASFDQIETNPEVRACIVTGTGAGFCAGADLSAGQATQESPHTRAEESGQAMRETLNPLIKKILNLPIPTIAAVNGVAAGGGYGLALSFDLVIASERASFKLVFTPQLGVIPDLGASWHAPHLLGRAQAIARSYFGDSMNAEEAVARGLIWKVVPHDALAGEANRVAAELVRGPTQAYVAVRHAFDHASASTLEQQLDYEAQVQPALIATDDFLEGVAAFAMKRKPVFKGR
ncbi:MAG: enoyl-CoA hydratase-related protein [Pseudomonadota bacterium]